MEVTLSVSKSSVMNEVAKLTSYIGAKITTSDGSNAYDQVFTTNDDYALLERYWRDAINIITGHVQTFITSVSDTPQSSSVDLSEVFSVTMDMPTRYDTTQTNSVESSLFSFFVYYVTSGWLSVSYKSDSEAYAGRAANTMKDILSKLFYKKRPTR